MLKTDQRTQIIFMDRNDHKLELHRIPTNTPQKSLHQIDLQENIVLRIKKERRNHLATAYGPIGLW